MPGDSCTGATVTSLRCGRAFFSSRTVAARRPTRWIRSCRRRAQRTTRDRPSIWTFSRRTGEQCLRCAACAAACCELRELLAPLAGSESPAHRRWRLQLAACCGATVSLLPRRLAPASPPASQPQLPLPLTRAPRTAQLRHPARRADARGGPLLRGALRRRPARAGAHVEPLAARPPLAAPQLRAARQLARVRRPDQAPAHPLGARGGLWCGAEKRTAFF